MISVPLIIWINNNYIVISCVRIDQNYAHVAYVQVNKYGKLYLGGYMASVKNYTVTKCLKLHQKTVSVVLSVAHKVT